MFRRGTSTCWRPGTSGTSTPTMTSPTTSYAVPPPWSMCGLFLLVLPRPLEVCVVSFYWRCPAPLKYVWSLSIGAAPPSWSMCGLFLLALPRPLEVCVVSFYWRCPTPLKYVRSLSIGAVPPPWSMCGLFLLALPAPLKYVWSLSIGALLQDFTQDSATQTGWRRTKRSGDGKMIALYSPGICGQRYRSFP